VFVGRTTLGHPRSDHQQAEIPFSCPSLPQNLSMFVVGYVCTSGAAATELKYLQQEVHFKETFQARG